MERPQVGGVLQPGPADQAEIEPTATEEVATPPATPSAKQPWPKDLTEQIKAVAAVLAETRGASSEDEIATRFTGRGRWRERLPTILDMLVALGRLETRDRRYLTRL